MDSIKNGQSNLDEALTYLDRSWSVFPVWPRGKNPLILDWKQYQTRRPTKQEVQEWWTTWPDAGIAIVTGDISNLIVVDADGEEGVAFLKQLGVTDTVAVRTGGGEGHCHYYYKRSGIELRNSAKKIPGTDIRADGGYVVAPPSIHKSGNYYEWLDGHSPNEIGLADFPGPLLTLLVEEPNSRSQNSSGWISESLQGLTEGSRNNTFAKVVGRLHHDNWCADDIKQLLFPHANRVSFSEVELDAIIGSITKYPRGDDSALDKEESNRFWPVTLSQLLADGTAEINWVVDGLIPSEGVSILSGPAGYGKSWMLLDLAIESSRGGMWLERFKVQKTSVVYIDEESSPVLLRKRLTKLLASKHLSESEVDIKFIVGKGLCVTDAKLEKALREVMETVHPTLLILDSLVRVHHADENSATDMAKVFQIVKSWVRDYKCAVLFADHQRKIGIHPVSPDQLLRGSSEKVAFVDSLLSLNKSHDCLIVDHSKSRCAEPTAAFAIEIKDNPEKSATKVIYVGDAESLLKAERLEAAERFLAKTLTDGWTPRKELIEKCVRDGIPEKAVDEALSDWVKHGSAERDDRKAQEGRGGKQAYYRLRPPMPVPSLSPQITSTSPSLHIYMDKTETETTASTGLTNLNISQHLAEQNCKPVE